MKIKFIHWLAILLIITTGILHLITAGGEYSEARYMGVLFLANFFGAIISAFGIARRKLWWGWILGVAIAAGSIIGYTQSRTVGMPGMEVEEWYDPIGIAAMIVEGLFLVVFVLAKPWSVSAIQEPESSLMQSPKNNLIRDGSVILVVVMVSVLFYQLGTSKNSHNEHPLPETVISNDFLEQEYGIRMQLVAVTAAGGMVDVRYRIIDPEKAAKLMDEEDGGIMPMLHVQDELCTDIGRYAQYAETLLIPDSHMRTQQLVADRMYFTLIPNTRGVVSRGTSVIVVFGDVALEPTLVQ